MDIETALKILSKYTSRVYPSNSHGGTDEKIDLSGVCLEGADLTRIGNLRRWNFAGANLVNANLVEVDATGANFHGADLSGANLTGAILRCADLRGSKLMETGIAFGEIKDADIRGTDFSKIGKPSNLLWETAKGDRATVLPPATKWPPQW